MSEVLAHYAELITDPAHTLVEFTFVLLDYLVIQAVAARFKRRVERRIEAEHVRIDAEHGVRHGEHGEAAPEWLHNVPGLLGLTVAIDEDLPDNVVEFRHPDGRLVGRITVVD
jgi:hypothetical protein